MVTVLLLQQIVVSGLLQYVFVVSGSRDQNLNVSPDLGQGDSSFNKRVRFRRDGPEQARHGVRSRGHWSWKRNERDMIPKP